MEKSSVELISEKYLQCSTCSLTSHIQQTIKELLEFLIFYRQSEDNFLQRTEVIRSSEETAETIISQSELLTDENLWRENFELIIEGKWTLEDQPTSIMEYGLTLLGFYRRASRETSASRDQVLALVLALEEKVRKMIYYGAMIVAMHGPIANRVLVKNSKGVKRAKTKVAQDWSWMISIIEKLDSQGAYQECKTLGSAIQRTLSQMAIEREGKIMKPHLSSNDTIKRVFKQVFGIEAKNYKQPLKLLRRV